MLTKEQKITNYETLNHISGVRDLITLIVIELLKRAENHDKSKLESPELEYFTKYTKLLKDVEYESDEYKQLKEELKPALDHHFANNSHHPEHYKNGINDMNLVDIIEMLCDWKDSSSRNKGGNIRKSLEINAKKFGISDQLLKILENTVDLLFSS